MEKEQIVKYFEETLKLAKISFQKGEIPVGAVIVSKDGKVISKGYNKREKRKNPLLHAEIDAIIKASKKMKTWKLNGCKMFVNLEPCLMCFGASLNSHIEKIYFLLEEPKSGTLTKWKIDTKKIQKIEFEEIKKLKEETKKLLQDFFKSKR